MNSAAFLPAAVFIVSLIPFGTVHPQERLALGFVAAAVGAATLFRGAQPLGRAGARLLLVAAGAWLWEAVAFVPVGASGRSALQPGIAAALTAALSAAGTDTHPLAISPWLALIAWTLAGGLILLAAGTARLIEDEPDARRLAGALVGAGVAVVATAGLHRALHAPKIYWVTSVPAFQRDPFFAPFVSPNHGGAACAALLPLAVALAVSGRPRRRVLAGLAAAVLAGGVWFSGSRAAFLDAGAALAVLGVLGGWPRARLTVSIAAGISLGVGLLLGPTRLLMWLTESVTPQLYTNIEAGYSDVFTGRIEIYRDVLRLIAAAPWMGVGPGSFNDAYGLAKTTADFSHVSHAHQEVLQTLAEHGVPGLLLWGAAWVGLGVAATRGCSRVEAGGQRQMWAAVLGGLAALGVDCQVDFPLRIGALAVLAAVLAGVAVGLGTGGDTPASPGLGRARLVALVILCAGTGLAATAAAFLNQGGGNTAWGPPEPLEAQGMTLTQQAVDIPKRDAHKERAAEVSGLVADAITAYSGAVARVPTQWMALLHLAQLQRAARKTDVALQTIAAATAIYPTMPWPWMERARELRAAGDEAGARDAWRHMLTSNLPQDATPFVKEAMDSEGDAGVLAAAVLPDRADRWVAAGHLQEKLQQDVQAEAMYRKALSLNPKAGIELASALFRWGRIDEAEKALTPLTATCRVTLLTGDIAFSREQYALANTTYERAMQLCGAGERRVRLGLARARLAQNDMGGLTILRALVKEDPTDVNALRLLIRELTSAGHKDEADTYKEMLNSAAKTPKGAKDGANPAAPEEASPEAAPSETPVPPAVP